MKAQVNLVPNGSFEEYDSCPGGGGDFTVKHWFSPTSTSPDYYNPCNILDSGVPWNLYGYQYPSQGIAYTGIVLGMASDFEYREYLAVKLVKTLIKGQKYKYSYSIVGSESSPYGSNNFGILFITDTIAIKSNISSTTVYVEGLLSNSAINYPIIITDTTYWTEISGEYIASGCENYLILGNFANKNDTDHTISDGNYEVYYYVDDVILSESVKPRNPNIFTPNDDSNNDIFILSDTELFDPLLKILNRWGEVVFESNMLTWDGFAGVEKAPDGVYFYVLIGTDICAKREEKKTGFIQLVR